MTKISITLLLSSLAASLRIKTGSSGKIILCYHDISPDSWEYSLSPKSFVDHIHFLSRHAQVVTLSQLLSSPPSSLPKVAITFDDGFAGVYTHAYPILRRMGLTATVFIIGNNRTNPKHPLPSRLLTLAQLKKLHQSGWEIGWHTHSHANLAHISSSLSYQEIVQEKIRMEKQLGFKLAYFAYPNGRYSSATVAQVKSGKYRAAFTVNGGSAANPSNPYLIDRVTISRYFLPSHLGALLSPLGIFINRLFTTAWRIKDNL